MLSVSEREKVFIYRLNVLAGITYLPFEIKLPGQVKTVKGIILSCDKGDASILKIGRISLQSNDSSDVFLCQDIHTFYQFFNETSPIFPILLGGESDPAHISGKRPQRIPVEVNGKTRSIMGWYKPEIKVAHTVNIYIEYEVQEEGI